MSLARAVRSVLVSAESLGAGRMVVFKLIFVIMEHYVVSIQASKAETLVRGRARKGSGAVSAPEPNVAELPQKQWQMPDCRQGAVRAVDLLWVAVTAPRAVTDPEALEPAAGDTAVGGQRPRPRGAGRGRLIRRTTSVCAPGAGTRLCVPCGFGPLTVRSGPRRDGEHCSLMRRPRPPCRALSIPVSAAGTAALRPAAVQKLDGARTA